ncbi:hypothetical protein FOXG_01342 [Fusarium oxysporum f. sp. lycopersici 4287]|uniref:Zn(2)-C6 fungal-type domain-containing protein n=1 Tax=Fusarium oxysporum f. sp. lycopersici (strain 4287 / CBS 123668 / FGSC 9935 / NRRL 34936) TaxID=426428 RepID=A0A0J9UAT4_FUSO4|nr:hypothetical protein FOXG_01342 [Fusarium oxysporum f. sp. lycopersici 4287]KAJ9427949.1 hypothetical protein QL093DRAFT_2125629 [Fusarium oxysporum]KNA95972.1 hypothetical protein FOXG_01342 [Fusarium oxysporum f. sp. lycopersici 4287]
MAGVPTARGCDACRKQKKKCDQAKPACARCTRLKLQCTGSGVKRFVFKSENTQAAKKHTKTVAGPSSALSNDKTLVAGNLVHILEFDNPGYDISTYGWFVKDLPRHVGSSKPLDAAITAFVTGFGPLKDRSVSKVDALDKYVFALKALRESMQDPAQAFSADNMCSIYLISICQEWLGSGGASAGSVNSKHHEVLAYLLQNAILKSQFNPSDKPFMQTIFSIVVLESFTNPNIHLGPWFGQALSVLGDAGRPLKSGDGTSFASLNIGTMGEMSCFIRDPDQYLYQIQCAYALVQTEHPRVVKAAEEAVAKAKASGSTFLQRRMGMRFHTAIAAMLTMAAILNRILRSYDGDPVLVADAKRYVDESIALGRAASYNRPIAAAAVASPLALSLAALDDYRREEVEKLLVEYQTDFPGLNYFSDVRMVKRGFEDIDKNNQRKVRLLLSSEEEFDSSSGENNIDTETGPGCTIL